MPGAAVYQIQLHWSATQGSGRADCWCVIGLDASDHILVRAVHAASPLRVEQGRVIPGDESVDPELTTLLGTDSFAAVPLKAETGPVGLLLADNLITGRRIEDEEVSVLELLGMQAALAIERAHLTEALEDKVQSLEAATREIRENQERLVSAEPLSAIGEMAARVAHEIRNPLVAIGGFARSLLRSVGREDPKRESLVTAASFIHINLAGITQFRLRFAKDDNDDLNADILKLYSGNSSHHCIPAAGDHQLLYPVADVNRRSSIEQTIYLRHKGLSKK